MAFNYQRILTNDEEKILLHDLLDIKNWVDLAIDGKLNNIKKRFARNEREELKKRGASTMPVDDGEVVQNAFDRPGYKNRAQRDAEAS